MNTRIYWLAGCFVAFATFAPVFGATGDPQVMTDHKWYPGELSCSTFERLFKTEAALYKRTTGRDVATDEDKALAAWYWRNLNYTHSDDGKCDYLGKGFTQSDNNREYWRGLFGFGYSLCFTTHSQWCGEMEKLLGHCRARAVGVPGHTSFEVFLTGGPYGEGKWVLLDHDISTVVYKDDGSQLLSIKEIKAGFQQYTDPFFKSEKQHGWRVAGLHDKDAQAYDDFKNVSYEFGYYGPPPMVNLRSGESLRRYIQPGLDDGKTFVFWGQNFMANGIPGPERSRTWVNQPEKMYKSTKGTGYIIGQARYGNAVYTYTPDFAKGTYKEGVIDEDDKHVTFEFYSPYIIGGAPEKIVDDKKNAVPWGNYDAGNKNGLVLKGKFTCPVKVSIDQGKTWKDAPSTSEGMDLTDLVKGSFQYWLRFDASAATLTDTGLTIRTVCQCGQTVIPRLHDGDNRITYSASGQGFISAGPNIAEVEPHIIDGKLNSPTLTLQIATPRKEKAVHLYAMAHVASSNPPSQDVTYQIEFSTNEGKTWKPVVKDWRILRRGVEPDDFWSQSMCYGDVALEKVDGPVRVRFSNSGGKSYLRAEAHLVYDVPNPAPVDVTFGWKENGGEVKTASHTYSSNAGEEDTSWTLPTGNGTESVWVEYKVK
jgi:hypothetical protein